MAEYVHKASTTTITTSQAPDAKPVYINDTVTENWKVIVSVPDYEVPELVFGGTTDIVPGVGEIISPLLVCNTTGSAANLDIQTYRSVENNNHYIARNLLVPAYDTIPIPLNGQFFKSGDTLEVKCSANNALHVTLSYTLGQSEEDDVE